MPLSTAIGSGTWTPVLTTSTPGNLAITYTTQTGSYEQRGNLIIAKFNITTSAFTHTTASGNWRITGLPITGNAGFGGTLEFSGITKTGYTQFVPRLSNASTLFQIFCSGTGQAGGLLAAADMPTGGASGVITLNGTVLYTI